MTLEFDSQLHNRYRILETLGKGGMGAVYRAEDESLGVHVAVKENLIEDEEAIRQFRREATILANLRHQNLPRVTDHFVIEGQGQYLVMDFVEGEDLKQRMKRLGKLPEQDVILMGTAICDALVYLHNLSPPVLHRDIKPGNIKITPTGQVFLVDFGLAKIVEGSQQTTTGARGLTPGYSPPEQYGSASTDERSDIYSLSATLYAALTGSPPEDGLAVAINQATLTKIRDRSPKTSRPLSAVIEKGLEVQAEDRYQSALEFKQALLEVGDTMTRQAAAGEVTITPPPPESIVATRVASGSDIPIPVATAPAPKAIPAKPARRSRWLGIIAGMIIVGGLIAAGVFFLPDLLSGGMPFVGTDATEPPIPTNTIDTDATEPPIPKNTIDTGGAVINVDATPDEASDQPTEPPVPLTTPTGGSAEIAFVSNRSGTFQIWLLDLEAEELFQVTDVSGGACQPDWSPDGQQIIFVSPCIKNQQIYAGSSLYLISADGTGFTPLQSSPLGDYDPAWHPSEKKIAFTTIREFGRPQIWLMDLDTGESKNISNNVVSDFQPAWSPDGETIVFSSTRLGPTALWVMGPDGEDQAEFSRSGPRTNIDSVWSPDGEIIVFTQLKPSGYGRPRLFAAPWKDGDPIERGRNEFQLVPETVAGMKEADYSPDGYWLVFTSNPEGENHDIFIMRANGTDLQQITDDEILEFDPVWRPAQP
jgi:serine/threonine protein kinase